MIHRSKQHVSPQAFTLVELLLSISILSVVLLVTTSMLSTSMNQLRLAESRFGQFQEAQAAFESITKRLTSCEINPYYDYRYPTKGNGVSDTDAVPVGYDLESDLHFVSGPSTIGSHALLATGDHPGHSIFFFGTYGKTDNTSWKEMSNLVNSWGYYIEFGNDSSSRASFLNSSSLLPQRYRFRLKELQIPSENVLTYKNRLSAATSVEQLYDWFRTPIAAGKGETIAENMIALIVMPLRSDSVLKVSPDIAEEYYYDTRAYQVSNQSAAAKSRTRHRLPPLVQFTLVALDETSAQRLAESNGTGMPNLGLDGLFTNANQYDEDLATLEETLQSNQLRYRVFSTTVRLRNSRWTSTN